MKKLRSYKEFIIATDGTMYYVFSKEEYGYGEGLRSAEWEAGTIKEAIDFIDSYES